MIYFTADWHLGHQRVLEYSQRPFDNLTKMHDHLQQVWQQTVKPDDTVYMLGDVVLARAPERHDIASWFHALPGHKKLIKGNHDGCTNTFYKSMGFEGIGKQMTLLIGEHTVLLSHYPYASDQIDQRYLELRPPDIGLPLLCGHIHHHWKQKDKMWNVGVDANNFQLVPETTILNWIKGGLS